MSTAVRRRRTPVVNAKGQRIRKIEVPDLAGALERSLREIQEKDASHWDPTVLHASDLGYSSVIEDPSDRLCARQLWLRINEQEPKPHTTGEMLMFEFGHSIHEQLSKLIQRGFDLLRAGWYIAHTELSVDEHLDGDIIGTLDVEMYGPNGEKIVVDYKTKRGRAFYYLDAAKPTNVIQVQNYAKAVDADYAIVLYVDREGSNFVRQFVVPRDDAKVERAVEEVEEIVSSPLMPGLKEPKITVRENKGPDSVVMDQPWQCEWCSFLGDACRGAVPKDVAGKVVGHLVEDDDGIKSFRPRDGYEDQADQVRKEVERQGLLEPEDDEEVDLSGEHSWSPQPEDEEAA